MEVRFASDPKPQGRGDQKTGGGNTVFVGGLSYQSTQDSLEEFFKECGKITNVRIAMNEDGKPRGFAHIEFENEDSVQSALKLSGRDLDGRSIRVDVAGNKGGRSGERSGRGGFGGSRGGSRGGFRGGRGGRGGHSDYERKQRRYDD